MMLETMLHVEKRLEQAISSHYSLIRRYMQQYVSIEKYLLGILSRFVWGLVARGMGLPVSFRLSTN